MCMNSLPAYVHVHLVCAWYLQGPEEGITSPGPGVADGYEPPHGFWEPNSSPLQGQQVLLTSKPSLQPPSFVF